MTSPQTKTATTYRPRRAALNWVDYLVIAATALVFIGVLAVNNTKIAKTSDLDKASKVASRLWRITVVRGGQQINVTLGG